MRVHYHTFGCKANQYDTERMRQELEARGSVTVDEVADAEIVVINTCTVTNQADADARRLIRRVQREHPAARVVVAGCSAALRADDYRAMDVAGVVEGHDPVAVAGAALARAASGATPGLVQLTDRRSLDRIDTEPVGAELLRTRRGATRGWLKIQGKGKDTGSIKLSGCSTPVIQKVANWALGYSFAGYDAKFELKARDNRTVLATLNRDGIHYFSGTLADGTPVVMWRDGQNYSSFKKK